MGNGRKKANDHLTVHQQAGDKYTNEGIDTPTISFFFFVVSFGTFQHVGARVVVSVSNWFEHRVPVDARRDSGGDDQGFLQAVDMPTKSLIDTTVSIHRKETDLREHKKVGDRTDVQMRHAHVGCAMISDKHTFFLCPTPPFAFLGSNCSRSTVCTVF